MESKGRVSGWSRAALWSGAVWFTVGALVAVGDYLIARPWARGAVELLMSGGVAVAVTLVVLGFVVCAGQAIVSLVGIRQCLLSQGILVGLGRAYAGMMLTGLGSSAMVFAALLHLGRVEPMAFGVPAVVILLAGVLAWRSGLHGKLTSLATTRAEPGAADPPCA